MAGYSLRIGLVQLNSGDDPALNLTAARDLVRQAAAGGARLVLTPETTNLISPDRDWQARALRPESADPTLAALRTEAAERGIWLLIGSLALAPDRAAADGDGDGRFHNRSFLIAPDGTIAARYDKIHMFDVAISETERFQESAAYRPGDQAVLAAGPVPVGMSICYDLRFAHLFRALAQAGAQLLTVPAAFHPVTGAAHWEVLLRARAIETGCFVLAAAQCGIHPAPNAPGRTPRASFGHSLAVDPWGRVLADGGAAPGATLVDLDLSQVAIARSRIPSLFHDRRFGGPWRPDAGTSR